MKNLFLILTLVSTSAMAEWTLVGANDLGITTYVDLDTIHKAGNTFKMWSLYDYKIAGAKVLSMKS